MIMATARVAAWFRHADPRAWGRRGSCTSRTSLWRATPESDAGGRAMQLSRADLPCKDHRDLTHREWWCGPRLELEHESAGRPPARGNHQLNRARRHAAALDVP